MLLTSEGLRDRKERLESMKTDSTVKEGPRKDSRVERSGSSVLWQGRLSDLGSEGEGLQGWYSLGAACERSPVLAAGAVSTDTG